MSLHSKVVWSQGMFLLPHHFQQEARHVEYMLNMRLRGTGPHGWGFFELVLDAGDAGDRPPRDQPGERRPSRWDAVLDSPA